MFPPQEGYNRTCIEKGRRGGGGGAEGGRRGGEDNGDVLKFNVGVGDRWDDVDGHILVIVVIVIDWRTGGMRRRLALVEVVCKRPEIPHESLQKSVLAGADLLDPYCSISYVIGQASGCRR